MKPYLHNNLIPAPHQPCWWRQRMVGLIAVSALCLVLSPMIIFAQTYDIERGKSRTFTESAYCPGATQFRVTVRRPSYLFFTNLGATIDFFDNITLKFAISVSSTAPLGSNSMEIQYEFGDIGIFYCSKTFYYTIVVIGPPAPVANFSAKPTFGLIPLTVQFTDLSSGGSVTSRLWNFGNGQTSTLTSPSHTYQNPGQYTVSLTLTGPGGTDTETKQNYITVTRFHPDITLASNNVQVTVNENDSTTYSLPIGNSGAGELYFSISASGVTSLNQKVMQRPLVDLSSDPTFENRVNDTWRNDIADGKFDEFNTGDQLSTNQAFFESASGAAPWLIFSPSSGMILPNGSQNISLTFRTTKLATDTTYRGSLLITSNDPDETQVNVPVSLTIPAGPNPKAYFSVSPASGFIGTTFTVDASASRDGQTLANLLEVRWDWENDGIWDTPYSTTKTASYQYRSPGTKVIKLEVKDADGNTSVRMRTVSVSNRAPAIFDLLLPANGDTVRVWEPVFKWRASFDPDLADTVRYRVFISTSPSFSSAATDTFFAGSDTTLTLPGSLQQLTRYYWRVHADDRWGQSASSIQSRNFLVADLTPPQFTIGILQNPILTDDINLYAIPSEPLIQGSVSAVAIATPGDSLSVMMTQIDPANRVYQGDYTLRSSGTIRFKVSGRDTWNNAGFTVKAMTVQLIKSSDGSRLMSVDGRVNFALPVGAVSAAVYFTMSSNEVVQEDPVSQNVVTSLAPVSSIYALGPSPFALAKPALLTFHYTDEQLARREESKLGIYRLEESGWQYVQSEVDTRKNIVQAQVRQTGKYRVLWNANQSTNAVSTPDEFALLGNYPNPFNPETTIKFALPKGFVGRVTLKIYDLTGREVTTLMDEIGEAGHYAVHWDGRDNQKQQVTSGVYIYRLWAGQFDASKKMLLIR